MRIVLTHKRTGEPVVLWTYRIGIVEPLEGGGCVLTMRDDNMSPLYHEPVHRITVSESADTVRHLLFIADPRVFLSTPSVPVGGER